MARRQFGDGIAERAMHLLEQRHISLERAAAHLLRTREPVGALYRKRSPRAAGEPPQTDVLPVRGVHDQLPDVVTPGLRTPRGALRRQPADGTPQVRTVPRARVVRGVDDGE